MCWKEQLYHDDRTASYLLRKVNHHWDWVRTLVLQGGIHWWFSYGEYRDADLREIGHGGLGKKLSLAARLSYLDRDMPWGFSFPSPGGRTLWHNMQCPPGQYRRLRKPPRPQAGQQESAQELPCH